MGCTCPDCAEWFEVCYNNIPGNQVRYCPLCGYEADSEDDWIWDEEDAEEESP